MKYYKKRIYSVLTNGETDLELVGSKYSVGVLARKHIFGQDGLGNLYIDGKPARVEIRAEN